MNFLRIKYSSNDGADKIPTMLGLKIILHYGSEIGVVPIGNISN